MFVWRDEPASIHFSLTLDLRAPNTRHGAIADLLRRIPDKHGNLQRNSTTLDEREGTLTASQHHRRCPMLLSGRTRRARPRT